MRTLKELKNGAGWVVECTIGPYGIGGGMHNKGFLDPELYVFRSKEEAEEFIAAHDLAPVYIAVEHMWGVPEWS
jgi:hypothetical protein